MTIGITRDEALAQEIINVLFCKIYDEMKTRPIEKVTFQMLAEDSANDVKAKIVNLFEGKVKIEYSDVFDAKERINLDSESLSYVVRQLQSFSIKDAERDVITEAFEVFIGPALRGGEGQFFTPLNVIKMMIEMLNPSVGELLIDPACGSGAILILALEHIWRKIEKNNLNLDSSIVDAEKKKATGFFVGIDKDEFLAQVTRAYMAIVGDGSRGVFCENSRGNEILGQYNLAKVWKKDNESRRWVISDVVRDVQAPQVLFIERCLQLLKDGGRMGIILPESLFGSPLHGYIMECLRNKAKFIALVSMPEELFQPYTHNKTCVAIIEKTQTKEDYPIFMAIADWCGHDSRGNPVPYDDTPRITEKFKEFEANMLTFADSRLGFVRHLSEIRGNIFIPKYYDPEIDLELKQLQSSHELMQIGQLVKQKIISVSTGVEIGKLAYGTGTIPFVRTSDISNWELKIDPKHGVSEEIFRANVSKADIKEHDILMVRDGSYLIGTVCMITKYDTKILFQSHICRLRVLKPDVLSPFLLLVALNSPIVKKQIRAKQFTQNIIDSLGNRLMEIVIPIPRSKKLREILASETQRIIEGRAELREKARQISAQITRESQQIHSGSND
jgi:type I restriction enzyme M protein